ncbi:hypothetical protein RCL10_10495 [Staphylococcus lloydii]|uniref:hypothetical protein n=1 Tax=Staphylococcus lloydii TaxID=2781774 RepID=UPI002927F72D|nr:hypothetical protein [Staphylococcus lloydii]MDU9418925.1 hypothetical protein [Staphylococcus lloydii]
MTITILTLLLIVNLLEALYLGIKMWGLKKRQAPDRDYKIMVDKVRPLMTVTLILSIIILIIIWIIE